MSESSQVVTREVEPRIEPKPTPIAAYSSLTLPESSLSMHEGAITPRVFTSVQQEVSAALSATAVFDLGYRIRIQVAGEDRLRWLNGMVSNAVQTLADGEGNYTFILNAQGRIQGDAYVYRDGNHLLLDTGRSQAERLFTHLDHFIIMDDVELRRLDDESTTIGIAGPQAAAVLGSLGLPSTSLEQLRFQAASFAGIPVTLVRAYEVLVPRFELWFAPEHAATIWQAISAAGATPAGAEALESLRILEGTPRFGVDFTDRHLAQETSQNRALNFTKGCYLGQEIVERIRSRATVHRFLHHFELSGRVPKAPVELVHPANPASIGQLTSIAEVNLFGKTRGFAIGFVRAEAIESKTILEYPGGVALLLNRPPTLHP